jgi:hypothetical protein
MTLLQPLPPYYHEHKYKQARSKWATSMEQKQRFPLGRNYDEIWEHDKGKRCNEGLREQQFNKPDHKTSVTEAGKS